MQTPPNQIPAANLIPPPAELRERLAVALREAKLLRGLLRLAEKTAGPRPVVTGAGRQIKTSRN